MSQMGGKTRLETWKEIAAYLGKDERTVRRWEAERGLPVRRLPGQSRSRIYAETEALDRWLAGPEAAAEPPAAPEAAPAAETARPARPRADWRVLAAVGAATLTVAGAVAALFWLLPGVGQRPPPIEAQRLYVKGMDDFRQRTAGSLNRALREFTGAIQKDPDYAEAYVGLADTYNLLREFTLMPAKEAYPLADAAAKKALSLNPRLAEGHAALAFVEAYWRNDAKAAQREYERAIALDPNSAQARHWFATFLLSQRQYRESLQQFDQALALDPTSKAIRADRAFALNGVGRKSEALEVLRTMERTEPNFLSPHNYLAGLAFGAGRDQEFLAESTHAADMMGDRHRLALLAEARKGFAEGGRRGMLEHMAAEQKRQVELGVQPAYTLALTYAYLGDAAQADTYLRLSVDRREEWAGNIREQREIFARVIGAKEEQALENRIWGS
jgi:tetratricopeptide (TPR) repeat protein